MSIISELVVKLSADSSQLNRGLAEANSAVGKTSSTISTHSNSIMAGIGGVITAGATVLAATGAAAAVAGASFMSSASQIQGYRTTLMTLYGDSDIVAQKLQWIFQFAKSTPFEVPQLVSAFVRLKSYGIEGEAALQTLGDAAAALGKPLELAVEAVSDAMQGEFERLKEFGVKAVVLNKDNYEKMGQDVDSIGKTVLSYVDKNGKQQFQVIDRNNKDVIQSTLFSIWNDKYKGGMEAQSKTFAGMVSNIKDNMTQAGLAIMGFDTAVGNFKPDSLFVKISDATKALMDYIGAIDWAAIGTKITSWINVAVEAVLGFWTLIQPGIDSVWSAIQSLVGIFQTFFNSLSGNTNIMESVAAIFNVVAAAVAGFLKWLNDSPAIIQTFGAAINVIVNSIDIMVTNIRLALEVLGGLFDQLMGQMGFVAKALTGDLSGAYDYYNQKMGESETHFKNSITLTGDLKASYDNFIPSITSAYTETDTQTTALNDNALALRNGVIPEIKNHTTELSTNTLGLTANAFSNDNATTKINIFSGAVAATTGILDTETSAVNTGGSAMVSMASDVSNLTNKQNSLADAVKDVTDAMKIQIALARDVPTSGNLAGNNTEYIEITGLGTPNGVASWIDKNTPLSELNNYYVWGTRYLASGKTEDYNVKAISARGNTQVKTKDKTIADLLGIPKMALGGIVPGIGNTDSVPAMLTPGELVLPKNSWSNSIGNNKYEFHVHGNVYGVNDLERTFSVFFDKAARKIRSMGG